MPWISAAASLFKNPTLALGTPYTMTRNSGIADKPRGAFRDITSKNTVTLKPGLGVTEGH